MHCAGWLDAPDGSPILTSLALVKSWGNPYQPKQSTRMRPWAIFTGQVDGGLPQGLLGRHDPLARLPRVPAADRSALGHDAARGNRRGRHATWSDGCRPAGRCAVAAQRSAWTISRPADRFAGRTPAPSLAAARPPWGSRTTPTRSSCRCDSRIIDEQRTRPRLRRIGGCSLAAGEAAGRPEACRGRPLFRLPRRQPGGAGVLSRGANWQDRVQYGFTWHNPERAAGGGRRPEDGRRGNADRAAALYDARLDADRARADLCPGTSGSVRPIRAWAGDFRAALAGD